MCVVLVVLVAVWLFLKTQGFTAVLKKGSSSTVRG